VGSCIKLLCSQDKLSIRTGSRKEGRREGGRKERGGGREKKGGGRKEGKKRRS
jgi:hypothetical protein